MSEKFRYGFKNSKNSKILGFSELWVVQDFRTGYTNRRVHVATFKNCQYSSVPSVKPKMRQDVVYAEFHSFNWDSFVEFKQGLLEILKAHLESLKQKDPSVQTIPAAERQQLVDQAKSFFFCTITGNILNLDEYYTWKRTQNVKTKELSTDVETSAEDVSVGSNDKGLSEAPYSSNYQQLVELIMSGKPVPGIKKIPDTVLVEQKSESKAAARPKPWKLKAKELEKSEDAGIVGFGDVVGSVP